MPPKTNEDLIHEFEAKFVLQCSDGKIMKDINPNFHKQWLRTILEQKDKQREEAVAEARSTGVNDGYKLAVKHLKEAYKQNDRTTTIEAIEWLADNARLFTPPTN